MTYHTLTALTLCLIILRGSCKRHEISLDPKYLFAWEVNEEEGKIILEATGETQGYIGLGFNSIKGKMDKAEMSIGGIHNNGQSYYGIYTGHKHKVSLSPKKKWNLLEAKQNSTHTYLKYERSLGGNNYVPIKDIDLYVIWALGKSDKIKKHHGHGKFKVNLINPNQDFLQIYNPELFNFYLDF